MYGGDLDNMFIGMIVISALIGAAILGLCLWLVPLIWGLIKPWLHAITG